MREWRCQEQEGRLGSGGSGTDAKRARFSRKRCCSVALLAISRYQARYLARVLIIMLILHVEFESFLSCFSALTFLYNLPNIKILLASSRYLSFPSLSAGWPPGISSLAQGLPSVTDVDLVLTCNDLGRFTLPRKSFQILSLPRILS